MERPNAEMKRRLQFYGYVFSYRYRIVTSTAPNAPQPLKDVVSSVEQVADDGDLMKRYPFNMVLINEYELGQGIMAHNDAPLIFGPIIAIVSLLSPCIISFFRGDERRDIVLEPRSLLIMQDEARYEWTHEISKNHIDIVRHPCTQEDGQLQSQMEQTVQRSTRVSITLRHVLQTHLNDVFT
ncbi:hypothetical protein MIR68_006654 [Amoeboaphelidium protococcarum]|nr:hypothetical protein MIR68_006654 [Amoeboaphelidium protococcarum]